MRSVSGVLFAIGAVATVATPATANETIRVFGSTQAVAAFTLPRVLSHPEVDGFLVVGREGDEAKTRRLGVAPDGSTWTHPTRGLGVEEARASAFHPDIASYLMPTNRGYLRLDEFGRIRRRNDFAPSHAWSNNSNPVAIAGARRWMVLTWSCKFGCVISAGVFVGPGLRERTYLAEFPAYFAFEQIVWDPDRGDLLMLWTAPVEGRSPNRLGTYGQHFRPDGSLLGDRFEVVRRWSTTYDTPTHMVRNPRREEWLIVYRRGQRIKGRFLRGDRLSRPFAISGPSSHPVSPSAAYNARSDSYLVTWLTRGGSPELRGRWLTATGRRTGKELVIHDPAHTPAVFEAGYSACNASGRCLVVWNEDDIHGAIHGRFVSP